VRSALALRTAADGCLSPPAAGSTPCWSSATLNRGGRAAALATAVRVGATAALAAPVSAAAAAATASPGGAAPSKGRPALHPTLGLLSLPCQPPPHPSTPCPDSMSPSPSGQIALPCAALRHCASLLHPLSWLALFPSQHCRGRGDERDAELQSGTMGSPSICTTPALPLPCLLPIRHGFTFY
jgi:hypothetical protein